MWMENPGDALSHAGDGSAAAADSSGTPESDASGATSEAPDYPPFEIRIQLSLDPDDAPRLVEDAGLPWWIVEKALQDILLPAVEELELTPNTEEDDEDE